MRLRGRRFAYILLTSTMIAGCATSEKIPAPEPPKIMGQMAAPIMPPRVVGLPVSDMSAHAGKGVSVPAKQRVGDSYYVEAEEDRVYKISVGVGGGTNGPQQVAVELPPGEHINAIHWANPSLMSIKAGRVGSARGGRGIVLIKPLHPVAPRVENVSILTTQRHIRVDVYVKEGRVANKALKLQATADQAASIKGMGRGYSAEALCVDNNFAWNKDIWWAPTKVCGLATPQGTYQTIISFPLNIQKMPAVVAYATSGDGISRPEVVNFRVGENRQMYVDNIWPVLRLNGDSGSVDIHRGGGK